MKAEVFFLAVISALAQDLLAAQSIDWQARFTRVQGAITLRVESRTLRCGPECAGATKSLHDLIGSVATVRLKFKLEKVEEAQAPSCKVEILFGAQVVRVVELADATEQELQLDAPSWSAKFGDVRGLLTLRIRDARGQLVRWAGAGGTTYTCGHECSRMTKPLADWFSSATSVKLWAKLEPDAAGSTVGCRIEIYYGAQRVGIIDIVEAAEETYEFDVPK